MTTPEQRNRQFLDLLQNMGTTVYYDSEYTMQYPSVAEGNVDIFARNGLDNQFSREFGQYMEGKEFGLLDRTNRQRRYWNAPENSRHEKLPQPKDIDEYIDTLKEQRRYEFGLETGTKPLRGMDSLKTRDIKGRTGEREQREYNDLTPSQRKQADLAEAARAFGNQRGAKPKGNTG